MTILGSISKSNILCQTRLQINFAWSSAIFPIRPLLKQWLRFGQQAIGSMRQYISAMHFNLSLARQTSSGLGSARHYQNPGRAC